MAPSSFDIPRGAVAEVSVIDSTLDLQGLPTSYLLAPSVPGFDHMGHIPTWSFLIQGPNNRKVVFDLGVPPDPSSFSPAVQKKLDASGWTVKAEKHVADILADEGVDLTSVDAVIWSHWHWDHIGDPSTFPASTDLVVGPGFKAKFGRGYPTNPDSPVRESYWQGRNLVEVDFSDPRRAVQIGPFRAIDYFGNGSFYLLDTPGHATGHLAGLARTTTDTFIFMGGDLCHHGAELRPSSFAPYPEKLDLVELQEHNFRHIGCPGEFKQLHQHHGRLPDEPLFFPAMGEDVPLAIETIKKSQIADAHPNVLFMFAHDQTFRTHGNKFPKMANDWKARGLKQEVFWAHLEDLVPALGGEFDYVMKSSSMSEHLEAEDGGA